MWKVAALTNITQEPEGQDRRGGVHYLRLSVTWRCPSTSAKSTRKFDCSYIVGVQLCSCSQARSYPAHHSCTNTRCHPYAYAYPYPHTLAHASYSVDAEPSTDANSTYTYLHLGSLSAGIIRITNYYPQIRYQHLKR